MPYNQGNYQSGSLGTSVSAQTFGRRHSPFENSETADLG